MVRRLGVFARMGILAVVTAADVAAGQTQTQMDPGITDRQAILAAFCTGGHVLNHIQVITLFCHATLP